MRTLATAQNAVIRDNHFVLNPVTGLYERSTLIEMAATNLAIRSEALDNGTWIKEGVSIGADVIQAPDGLSTADSLTEDTSSGNHRAYQGVTITSGATYAASVHFRASGRFRCALEFGNGSDVISMFFRADTGTFTTAFTGGGVLTRAYVAQRLDGWWRLVIVGSIPNTTGFLICRLLDANGTVSYVGNGSSSASFWGAQLELGSFATSYIATTSASVARSADTFALPLGAPLTTPQSMMIYVRFIELGTILLSGFQRVLMIGDATAGLRQLNLRVNPGNVYGMVHETNGGSGVNSQVSTTPSLGDLVELVGLLAAGGNVQLFQYINGGAVDAGAVSGALALPGSWSANTVVVGGGAAAFQKIRMAAGQQTIATMRALAA
jgi:hypothetical protein